MLTCKDVAEAIGRDEWRAAPRWRRLALRLHLLMCPHCRRYAAQIRAIGTAVRSLIRAQGENPKTLERIKKTILSPPRDHAELTRDRAVGRRRFV